MGDILSESFGLGSSSTVTADAVHAYWGVMIPYERPVRESCEIESEVIKTI